MISREVVDKIKSDLVNTPDHINTIADRYKVSKATVNNINAGKSHIGDNIYPLRQLVNYSFTDNEVAFIRKLAKEGYSAKQIHIILTQGSYSTISNIISFKTRATQLEYVPDKFLDERLAVFDFISTPHTELVNKFINFVTIEDSVYIKLLGRFMADLLDTLEAFLPLIETEMVGFTYTIETREDIAKYLEWGGSSFSTIWWIKNIFNNKINRVNEEMIHYDNFPIQRFREVDPSINLNIVKEMIMFDTKENYRKSDI